MPLVGDRAPDFSLPSTFGGEFNLQQALADVSYLVVAFYPKDNTSG